MSKFEQVLADLGLKKQSSEEGKSSKELKKLLHSYIEVMTHKLGRAPTPEEFFKEINGGDDEVQKSDAIEQVEGGVPGQGSTAMDLINAQQTQNASLPSVLDTKVYFGVNDKKEPDPRQMLYFEHPDGGTYDIHEGRWLPTRPAVLDHLQSRPLYHDDHDIMNVILHGLLSHSDYHVLSEHGLISPNAEKLWQLSLDLQQKWHEVSAAKQEIKEHGMKRAEHESDIRDLLNIIDDLQDQIHSLQVQLQELSPEHDYSEEETMYDPAAEEAMNTHHSLQKSDHESHPIFSGTPHVIMSLDNPMYSTDGTSKEAAMHELHRYGSKIEPAQGMYKKKENSIIIHNPSDLTKIKNLARRLGQESIIFSHNGKHQMMFLHGDQAGGSVSGEGHVIHSETPNDFYTTVHHKGKPIHFTYNFNFPEDSMKKAFGRRRHTFQNWAEE